jgi:hypothetical protein
MNSTTNVRTPEEVIARFRSITPLEDFFGAERGDLLNALTGEQARTLLPDLTDEEVAGWGSPHDPRAAAVKYWTFARGKIEDHRGLSANRAVDHLRACAWLLGDDVFAAVESADYAQYGAPKWHAFLTAIGEADLWPADDEELERMRRGLPCTPACIDGCDL